MIIFILLYRTSVRYGLDMLRCFHKLKSRLPRNGIKIIKMMPSIAIRLPLSWRDQMADVSCLICQIKIAANTIPLPRQLNPNNIFLITCFWKQPIRIT